MEVSTLETLAQLSIGLVGFAGVVSALGRSRITVETRRFRIKALLMYSTTALAASVLPLVLESFGLESTLVWVSAGIVLMGALIGIAAWFATIVNPLTRGGHLPTMLAYSLGFVSSLVIILLIYGIVFARVQLASIYLVGLCWALGMGVFHFCMLVLSIQVEDEGT